MDLPSYFRDFLINIRPSDKHFAELRDGHRELRERWNAFAPLKPVLLADFLQGSYRRGTTIRPSNGRRSDVDIVVVTKLSEQEYTPERAQGVLKAFLDEYYKGQWSPQGRSIGIELDEIEMDLVLTSAPTESEIALLKAATAVADEAVDELSMWDETADDLPERRFLALLKAVDATPRWRTEPLRIPDREAKRWENTHPLAQWRWTVDKNSACNKHFLGVVRAIKWWKSDRRPTLGRPRGYPLERIVAEYCPDGVSSVAQGLTLTFEGIAAQTADRKPLLLDHGTSQDVLARLTQAEFLSLRNAAAEAATLSRRALDSTNRAESIALWRELLGDKFPPPPSGPSEPPKGGFTRRDGPSEPSSGRFA